MERTCCFIGHRTISECEQLKQHLLNTVEKLIVEEKIDTFLFGSKSEFNSLCLNLVTQIKEKYPHIKRVYVRAEYPYIDEEYRNYLLQRYEDTYYPEKTVGAGRAAYIERNYEMIDKSRICIFYYKGENESLTENSGTKTAFCYAKKQNKNIINLV